MFGWELVADFLFGGIGFVAFVYGRRMGQLRPTLLGVLLMAYPYFVPNLWWNFGLGAALTAALFVFRE